MVDRILHIGYKFSSEYDKELLHRAAQVYVYKRPAAVVPYLVDTEKLEPAKAESLFKKMDVEMRKVNRQVLLQYSVISLLFMGLVVAGLTSQSYIFAGLLALPTLRLLYSTVRFIRRNPVRSLPNGDSK